jgi:hypothetical protein
MGTIMLCITIMVAILDFIYGYYIIGIGWIVLVVVCYKIGFFKRLNEMFKLKL